MRRRRLLAGGGALAAGLLSGGHTPYGQWVVYRKKHLLIGCHKRDPATYTLAKAVVATLQEHLPAASARVARAPNAGRLASLLGTDQLRTAVLAATEARAMAAGRGDFAPYGPLPLRLLAPLDGRLLTAHAAMPERHAWLVSAALLEHGGGGIPASEDGPLPWHPGSLRLIRGQPVPAAAAQ